MRGICTRDLLQRRIVGGQHSLEEHGVLPFQSPAGRELDRGGVDLPAVVADLVVEVGARGHTRCPHITDGLSLGHDPSPSHASGISAHMGVEGHIGVHMAHHDMIAVHIVVTHVDNRSVTRGLDGCSPGGAEVHALVVGVEPGDGIDPGAEAGGDVGAVDRSFQKGFADRMAFAVIEIDLALGILVAEDLQVSVSGLQCGIENISRIQGFAVLIVDLLIADLENVPSLDIPLEIHIKGVELNQVHDDTVFYPAVQGRGVETGVDHRLFGHRIGLQVLVVFGYLKAVHSRPQDADILVYIHGKGYAFEVVVLKQKGDHLSRPEAAEVHHILESGDHRVAVAPGDALGFQMAHQVAAPLKRCVAAAVYDSGGLGFIGDDFGNLFCGRSDIAGFGLFIL